MRPPAGGELTPDEELRHPACKVPGQIRPMFLVQIHREKGHFVRDIHATEALVEPDAVGNGERTRSHVDGIEVQVAVAIPGPVFPHAPREKTRGSPEETGRGEPDCVEGRPGDRPGDEWQRLPEFPSVLLRRRFAWSHFTRPAGIVECDAFPDCVIGATPRLHVRCESAIQRHFAPTRRVPFRLLFRGRWCRRGLGFGRRFRAFWLGGLFG